MKLKLNKKDRYILGCSSGPDSMALFYMLLKENYNFVVCNIDYNYRDKSYEETDLVRNECNKYNIPFYTKSVLFQDNFGNFEAWARDIRYDYFEEIGNQICIKKVLIAHNLDDSLETYLMQKERKSIVSNYGLADSYKRKNMEVIRPLLSYFKSQLKDYCITNNIPFIIDPTNCDIAYKRNYYRHVVLSKLSNNEKMDIAKEMKLKNDFLCNEKNKVKRLLNDNLSISIESYKILSNSEKCLALIIILDNVKLFREISFKTIYEIDNCISKGNFKYKFFINKDAYFSLDKNLISLVIKNIDYKFNFNDKNLTDYFEINYEVLYEKYSINKGYISPAIKSDYFKVSNYDKNIKRAFIDRKMPQYLRPFWPAIYDEQGNIIYVPRYRHKFEQKKDSILHFDINKLVKIEIS